MIARSALQLGALSLPLLMLGCAPTSPGGKVLSAVEAACADIMPLLPLAAALPVVGVYVVPGVEIGCATAGGLAKLSADPSSAAWLGQQMQMLKDALHLK